MIVFSCTNAEYFSNVFLPNKTIYLSLVHSFVLDKNFLCMEAYDSGRSKILSIFSSRHLLVPDLENYKALPYKRQSSIDKLDRRSLIRYSVLPWFEICNSLNKIRGFYQNFKKYYVVILRRQISDDIEEDEKAAMIFDLHSDAVSVLNAFNYPKMARFLGEFFTPYSWRPYLWVEYMKHPISLLGEISRYEGSYELGPAWCHYLLCFLKDSVVRDVCFSSIFGFVLKDDINFKKIIHVKNRDDVMSRVR